MDHLRARYGAGPLHLLATLATLAFAAAVLLQVRRLAHPLSFAVWFAAAIVAHDLIAFPLYTLLDRIAGRALRPPRAPARNYVRIPAALSALALVVWFPLVLRLSAVRYRHATGLDPNVFLGRWLLLTTALFAGSGLLYALRLRRERSARPPGRAAGPGREAP